MRNINNDLLSNGFPRDYFIGLKGKFYKILPMKENNDPTLGQYMSGLEKELIGCHSYLALSSLGGEFTSLLCILRYLIITDCDVKTVRGEVFRAIEVCEKLSKRGGEINGRLA